MFRWYREHQLKLTHIALELVEEEAKIRWPNVKVESLGFVTCSNQQKDLFERWLKLKLKLMSLYRKLSKFPEVKLLKE